jgi:hypothetical protein
MYKIAPQISTDIRDTFKFNSYWNTCATIRITGRNMRNEWRELYVLPVLALYYKPFAKEMEVISEGNGKTNSWRRVDGRSSINPKHSN